MIRIENLTVRVGDFSLSQLNLHVAAGEYLVLMGRSGEGKTTLLETICGLRRVRSGQIFLAGVDVTDWKPADRQLGYVPQDLALFPAMTVREHLQFALRLRRVRAPALTSRTETLSDLLGLGPLLDRLPQGLSGGQAQRVALGRALSFEPRVLLLDEPFSALDETTRKEMHLLLNTVRKQTDVTVIHVTHDVQEAVALADRTLRMEAGKLQPAD